MQKLYIFRKESNPQQYINETLNDILEKILT